MGTREVRLAGFGGPPVDRNSEMYSGIGATCPRFRFRWPSPLAAPTASVQANYLSTQARRFDCLDGRIGIQYKE
jgi:hypothetical protein